MGTRVGRARVAVEISFEFLDVGPGPSAFHGVI